MGDILQFPRKTRAIILQDNPIPRKDDFIFKVTFYQIGGEQGFSAEFPAGPVSRGIVAQMLRKVAASIAALVR